MSKKEFEDPIAKALGLPALEGYENPKDDEIVFEDVDQELIDNEFSDEETIEVVTGEVVESPSIPATPVKIEDDEYAKDIANSRQRMDMMIRDSHDAFEYLINIAKQTENPRAFEVASKMMGDIVSANKALIEMSEKKRESKSKGASKNVINNTTNNNLVLSTADFLKMLGKTENK